MGFGKTSKYKKVILSVFPPEPDGDILTHNVGKLVHFCELTPQKLPKVALFLEKRLVSDLSKQRLGYVIVAMKTFNELINHCRKHLPLFSPSIVRTMKVLLVENDYPELKILATTTFMRFADVQDEATQIPDLEVFVGYFVDMALNNNKNEKVKRSLRLGGLKGLRAYIAILDLIEELDAFLSRHMDPTSIRTKIIPAILENVQIVENEPNSNAAGPSSRVDTAATTQQDQDQDDAQRNENVQMLASEVLRDLASRVNNITVSSLLNAVLSYLENKWVPNVFPIHVLKTISGALKSQHNQIMMTRLLQYLDQGHATNIKRQLVITIVNVINENSPGPVIEIFDYLLKHLVRSIEICQSVPPPVDLYDQEAYQTSIIESVGTVSKKVPSPLQRIEAMSFIMNRILEMTKKDPNVPDGNPKVIRVLLECLLQVSQNLQRLPSESIPSSLLGPLLVLENNPIADLRVLVIKNIQCLLAPGRSRDQLWSSSVAAMSSNQNILTNEKNDVNNNNSIPIISISQPSATVFNPSIDELTGDTGRAIRDTLFHHAISPNNQPANVIAVYNALLTILLRCQNKELVFSIPAIFKLQKVALSRRKVPVRLARSLHSLVVAYLLSLSHLYESRELEAYINEILQQRKEKEQKLCRYIDIKSSPGGIVELHMRKKHIYNDNPKSKTDTKLVPDYIVFEKDKVINILSTIQSVTQEYKNPKKQLSHKHHDSLRNPGSKDLSGSGSGSGSSLNLSKKVPEPHSSDSLANNLISPFFSGTGSTSGTIGFNLGNEPKKVNSDLLKKAINPEESILVPPPNTLMLRKDDHANKSRDLPGWLLSKGLVFHQVVAKCVEENQTNLQSFEKIMSLIDLMPGIEGKTKPLKLDLSQPDSVAESNEEDEMDDSEDEEEDFQELLAEISNSSTLRMDLTSIINVF